MNFKCLYTLCLVAAQLLIASSGNAYEVTTHAGMSDAAIGKSVLSTTNIFDRLGLADRRDNLGRTYLDLEDPSRIEQRFANIFEFDKFRENTVATNRDVGARAWIMRGAVREDDTSKAVSYLPGSAITLSMTLMSRSTVSAITSSIR